MSNDRVELQESERPSSELWLLGIHEMSQGFVIRVDNWSGTFDVSVKCSQAKTMAYNSFSEVDHLC